METRHQLLILKPANRANWISFAVAHHLDKNYELAVQVRIDPPLQSCISSTDIVHTQCCIWGSCMTADAEK